MQASVSSIAAELRDDQVYVADGTEVTEAAVRGAIAASGEPIYVAVVDAGEDPDALAVELGETIQQPGAYVVLAGDEIGAAATEPFGPGEADRIAEAALARVGADDPTAVLLETVESIDAAVAGTASDRPASGDGGGGGDGGTSWLLLGALAIGAVLLFRRGRRQRAERAELAAELESQRRLLQAEVAVLADDVMRLEPQVRIHPEAEDDYQAAVSRYRVAEAAVGDARVDPVRLERVIDEARYSMARAEAFTEGREPPAPPEKLRHPGRHGEPALETDESGRPVYAGYPEPYYGGGWFGGGGGFFGGLLLGQMLGGPFGWGGMGYGMGHHHHEGGDGDVGGGDFGGGGGWGDFGGGDFGGGDFGGGDF